MERIACKIRSIGGLSAYYIKMNQNEKYELLEFNTHVCDVTQTDMLINFSNIYSIIYLVYYGVPGITLYQMVFFPGIVYFSRLAAGLFSCFLLRAPQGGGVDSTVQALATAGLRGPCSTW